MEDYKIEKQFLFNIGRNTQCNVPDQLYLLSKFKRHLIAIGGIGPYEIDEIIADKWYQDSLTRFNAGLDYALGFKTALMYVNGTLEPPAHGQHNIDGESNIKLEMEETRAAMSFPNFIALAGISQADQYLIKGVYKGWLDKLKEVQGETKP